jgi:DNA mismatch repair protein MutS
LEQEHLDETGRPKLTGASKKKRKGDLQLTLFAAYDHPLIEKLRALKLDELTPLEALRILSEWQQELEREDSR